MTRRTLLELAALSAAATASDAAEPPFTLPKCWQADGGRIRMSRPFVSLSVLALAIFAGTLTLPANGQPAETPNTRIERLEGAVLAPCCYTEPVSIHQSEIALKMRLEIVKWVGEGRSDREILGAYVNLYGAKVLVDPRTRPAWWVPWIPWLTMILAMGFASWLLRRWQAKPAVVATPANGSQLAELPDLDEDE